MSDDDDVKDEEISFKIVCNNKTVECINVIQIHQDSIKYLHDTNNQLKGCTPLIRLVTEPSKKS